MKHIFYFFLIFPIIWELYCFTNPNVVHKLLIKIKEQKYDDMSFNAKFLSLLMFAYYLWSMIGLFSSQWIIFLIILLFSLIPKKWAWFRLVDGFVSAALLLFVILNVYHFHINVGHWLMKSLFYFP